MSTKKEQTAKTADSAATMVRKIATATCLGGPAAIRKAADGAVMRVFGIARGKKTGEGDNGPWVGFKGQFQAINLMTGEVFVSGQCFLPGVASDVVEGALDAGDVHEVQFAFDIIKSTDDNSAVGYTYSAKPLVKPSETDPLSALASQLPELQLQIESK